MATEVILLKLGETMEEGSIVEWIKKEGDFVQLGDVLFTVETDKAVLEVEAQAPGFLRKILVPEGVKVPVLTVVALITCQADEQVSTNQRVNGEASGWGARQEVPEVAVPEPQVPGPRPDRLFVSPRARKAAQEKGMDLATVPGSGPGGRIVERDVLLAERRREPTYREPLPGVAPQPQVTPVARRAAEALGIDLTAVSGTGISGRITKADVEAAIAPGVRGSAPSAVPPPVEAGHVERVPLAGLRRIIAERMVASNSQTARVTLVTEADATELVKVREQLKASVTEAWGFAPGYNDLLGLVVARALGEFPYMNARLSQDGQTVERLPFVHLGMAVDTERGLLVPVIRDAEQKSLRAFAAEFRALIERAREGKSLPDDLSGGTFTVTNLGMYEIDAFTPIINLPEAAILGAGRIQPKPVVHNGEIVTRPMWTLSLTFDHRLVDGAPAARFLQRIKQWVEHPYLLLG